MNIKRSATSIWRGGKAGKGMLTTQSGTLRETPYSFGARFESGQGTNPEELIAAAHAGCFNMALSIMLEGAGFPAEQLETAATITLEKQGEGWTVTQSHLELSAKVPRITPEKFSEIAQKAKAGCPISKLLNAQITLNAKL